MKNREIQFLAEESERTLLTVRQHIKDLHEILYDVVDVSAWVKEYPLCTTGVAFFVGLEGAQILQEHQYQQGSIAGQKNKDHHQQSLLLTLSSLLSVLLRVESIAQTILSFVTNLLGSRVILSFVTGLLGSMAIDRNYETKDGIGGNWPSAQ